MNMHIRELQYSTSSASTAPSEILRKYTYQIRHFTVERCTPFLASSRSFDPILYHTHHLTLGSIPHERMYSAESLNNDV